MSDEPQFDHAAFNAMMGIHDSQPKVREEYIRAPFSRPGGKWHSLDHLVKYLPFRKVWVDACGGSGIVTINRPKSELEVFNDRHSGITAFYRCIRDSGKCRLLIDRLSIIVHSREEFIWCRDSWQNCHDDVERAARWYYMTRFSFSSLGRNFARATSGASPLMKALGRSLKLFPTIHNRFEEVQIENLDCCQCIRDFDSHDTVTYADPDYQDTTPGVFVHTADHNKLIATIKDCRGFVALSGYANPLYDSQHFWDDRVTWEVMVSSKAHAFTEENGLLSRRNHMDRGIKAEEVLWIKESK